MRSPAEFFAAPPSFSGSHEKTAQLVQAGTFQAGAIDFKNPDGSALDLSRSFDLDDAVGIRCAGTRSGERAESSG